MLFNYTHAISEMQFISAEDAGISGQLSNDLRLAFNQGEFKNLHCILVLRHGKIAIENYHQGSDEIWGKLIGKIDFNAETLHDLRSITKSIVSLLYGIALEQKLVPAVDQSLLSSFRQYTDLSASSALNDIKIEHALNMTMGLQWNEDLPYTSNQNSEIAMEQAQDRYHYILSRKVLHKPGDYWEYSGGATALIGRLISTGVKKDLLEYANEQLFGPLGIANVQWTQAANGERSVASGMRLRPRDLAKIGQLILNKGSWEGKQIIPKSWLDNAFISHADAGDGLGYSYQWWLGKMKSDGSQWISAFGNGSQRLIIIPDLELVVVITAGNYNQPEQWRLPVKIMSEYIIPAITG